MSTDATKPTIASRVAELKASGASDERTVRTLVLEGLLPGAASERVEIERLVRTHIAPKPRFMPREPNGRFVSHRAADLPQDDSSEVERLAKLAQSIN